MIHLHTYVENKHNHHFSQLSTNDKIKSLDIPPKEGGFGSIINRGKPLFPASAEIQNTLRAANNVPLQEARATSIV